MVAFLAPWVDYGGTDKGTVDWFRWLDRERFEPILITTQRSANRRLHEVVPFAREVWPLPELLPGNAFPHMIFDLLASRDVDVLHIMNSRLGFELLPDITALPRPPRVVVQLHVEEQDRSGYVRYVTTRYGNLVDAFSVTSRHLAQAVIGYGVPAGRTHVIHTAVDGEGEFAPGIVRPVGVARPERLDVLMAGRLVAQKDPLLAVRVALALRERTSSFAVHMVGEGELEADVQGAIREHRLEAHFHLYPAVADVRPWYEACDALLLTSTFEGVPYVAFEAMAMGLPVVAASLPGTRELVDASSGRLVEPRDDEAAYADALLELTHPEVRRRMAGAARERMRRDYPIQRMAREHERVYDDLLHTGEEAPGEEGLRAIRGSRRRPTRPLVTGDPIRLRARPIRGVPSVSVIVPCFNHGRYLRPCLESIRGQTHPSDRIQTIVVDDASTDPDTHLALDEIEAASDVEVVRLPVNGGPSAARNVAIDRAAGDFVLPLDADNLLLPDALASLVGQLANAGEQIGFVYPNLQYFGTRNDHFAAPSYNLALLAQGNYCDTCSLIDRWVFEAGIRYPEEYRVGHEDWEFVLMLAERGVYGIPADSTTLLYRKWGFTRSDVVEYSQEPFHQRLAERHIDLLGRSQAGVLKAAWNPAMSIVSLQEVEDGGESRERLVQRLVDQSFEDFEYVGFSSADFPRPLAPGFRRLAPELAASPANALFAGLETARGKWVLLATDTGSRALADRAFVEKLVRVLHADAELDVVALADDGLRDGFSLRLIDHASSTRLAPHAIAASAALLGSAAEDPGVVSEAPLASLLLRLLADGREIQWRQAPGPASPPAPPDRGQAWRTRSWVRPHSASELVEKKARRALGPAYPGLPKGWVRRWTFWPGWMPPETLPLCRHRDRATGEVVVTNDRNPPAGFAIEYDLGSIRRFGTPGTVPLRPSRGSFAVGAGDDGPTRPLGHLETAPLPGFEAVRLAIDPMTGAHTLVGDDDLLASGAQIIGFMGFIEPYPIAPKHPPRHGGRWGLRGLVRSVDRRARRHRYELGSPPAGDMAGELGAALAAPVPDTVPLWVDDLVVTDRYRPSARRTQTGQAARWVGAPLTWGDRSDPRGLTRAVSRRVLSAGRVMLRPPSDGGHPDRVPDAYLASTAGDGRRSLYSAMHPVTGDQLLTPFWLEANDMGYEDITLLGYLLEQAPVTGSLELARPIVPWASRFGVEARWA